MIEKYIVENWQMHISGRNKNHRFANGDVIARTDPPCDTLSSTEISNELNRLTYENEQLKHSIKCLEADKMELQQYIKRMQGDVE